MTMTMTMGTMTMTMGTMTAPIPMPIPMAKGSAAVRTTTTSTSLLPSPLLNRNSISCSSIGRRRTSRRRRSRGRGTNDSVTLGSSGSGCFFVNPLLSSSTNSPNILRCFSAALSPEVKVTLDKVVTSHKVIVFIKGTKEFPQCGFSNTVVQILNSLDVPFETINILENQVLRQALKEYSNWPTFPQLYIDGDFFGGCDITLEAYKSGELQEQLEKALCS